MTNADIIAAVLAVRDTAITNMFDRRAVIQLAELMGFPDEAEWISTHPHEYGTLILTGKLSDENET
ncbi:hypothetical protein FACS1894184_03520 [Clostridia bacterium]|nr:hypothetical protein FACS1894184_03520 [Clostridia bacterium]